VPGAAFESPSRNKRNVTAQWQQSTVADRRYNLISLVKVLPIG